MEEFLLPLMLFIMVIANVIGFVFFKRKKSLYAAAFSLLLLSVVFGGAGAILALIIIGDAFAIFYGLNLAYYLLLNSLIVFLLAFFVTFIRKYYGRDV